MEYGTAVHLAHDAFWHGKPYESAFKLATEHLKSIDQSELNTKERLRFDQMWDDLPELISCYYDTHEYEPQEMVEEEWWNAYWQLCGKIDRYNRFCLYDLKTASEIGGRQWRANFKKEKLRDSGLALYDWYLRQIGKTPQFIAMEVLIKPYKGSSARYELVELNEIMAYRERFDLLLAITLKEMVHWLEKYKELKPWPMSFGSQCVTKFGECDYLRLCNHGDSERNLSKYVPRQEHLEVRRGQEHRTVSKS